MRTLLLILLATLPLASGQQTSANSAAGLVGRWRSVETSKVGIGAVYEFYPNGTIDFSPGAIVDMPYRTEGDQLILPPDTTTGSEMKTTLTWPSNNVLRMSTQGQSEEYQRQGAADPRDRLLGEWLTSREMDGQKMPTEMFFYPSGKSLLVIRFTTQHGRYTVTNGRLVAEFGGRVGLDGTFDITNGVLSLQRSNGRVTKLARY
jgi:hypothetical protein